MENRLKLFKVHSECGNCFWKSKGKAKPNISIIARNGNVFLRCDNCGRVEEATKINCHTFKEKE